jgi:hypothetical protein
MHIRPASTSDAPVIAALVRMNEHAIVRRSELAGPFWEGMSGPSHEANLRSGRFMPMRFHRAGALDARVAPPHGNPSP